MLNEAETFYQVKTEALDDLFNLPLPEGFEFQEMYVEINENYVYFQGSAIHESTNNSLVIYLVIESINQDINLLSYLQ